jgi:hypothetical protein
MAGKHRNMTMVKRNGAWRAVYTQGTRVPKQ